MSKQFHETSFDGGTQIKLDVFEIHYLVSERKPLFCQSPQNKGTCNRLKL